MTKADLVFAQGPVHTGDPARTRATSLAVTGERISAVGHDTRFPRRAPTRLF